METQPVVPFQVSVNLGVIGNEGYSIFTKAEATLSNGLVSYPGLRWCCWWQGGVYSSAEMEQAYSIATAEWAKKKVNDENLIKIRLK